MLKHLKNQTSSEITSCLLPQVAAPVCVVTFAGALVNFFARGANVDEATSTPTGALGIIGGSLAAGGFGSLFYERLTTV